MKTPLKLGLYAAGLSAAFALSFVVAGAIVPADVSAAWTEQTRASDMKHASESDERKTSMKVVPGLSIEQSGYQIRDVSAPQVLDRSGTLSFRLTGPDGAGVTRYETAHDKDLHLIVVRSDGTQFRHVHPANEGDGVWSLPWQWRAAGSYRIFADIVPTELGTGITLTTTVHVGGAFDPVSTPEVNSVATTGDFKVELTGDLKAGNGSSLAFTVSRDGMPVVTLEPYLGAFGHLVALRDGDLGYLHVHPMGEPGDGETEPGPEISFMAEAPTAGSYLLYLDFQVAGEVHTAEFVIEATTDGQTNSPAPKADDAEHSNSTHSDH